ncbi:hypothetical protein CLU79DRAFT_782763 [Phycomyces nitens]|nr:hypothetical protein CLU79DRAFT_782763 [Phycomyces nitens]
MLFAAASGPSVEAREIGKRRFIFILLIALNISVGSFRILSQKSYQDCRRSTRTAVRRSLHAATYSAWALMRSMSLPARHHQR